MSEQPPPLRESLRLPGRGRLELRCDERRVVFRTDEGREHCFDAHPIFGESGRLAHAAARDGRSVLMARHQSDQLHVFDAEQLAFLCVPGFERLRRVEELHLHALDDGWLVITENGVALVEPSGRVRWRREGVTSGWRLLAESDEALWLRDGAGNVLGLDGATGREVST